MVESSTAKAAEMALKLDAQHRWAVTGTPLSRGLEDLFGLLVRSDLLKVILAIPHCHLRPAHQAGPDSIKTSR